MINMWQDQLQQAQEDFAAHPGDLEAQGLELQALKKLRHWLHVEELVLRQKPIVKWVKLGDSNTRFFQHVVREKTGRGRIDALMNSQCNLITKAQEAERLILYFYQQL